MNYVPKFHFSEKVIQNMIERFPESANTTQYELTRAQLDAFNGILDLWLSIPGDRDDGVNEDVLNAIHFLKEEDLLERLLASTKSAHSFPKVIFCLGELARIFHSLETLVQVDGSFFRTDRDSENNENALHLSPDIHEQVDSMRNLMYVSVFNKTLKQAMVDYGRLGGEHLLEPKNKVILQSGNAKVYVLVDIHKRRIYEVPACDTSLDTLAWKGKQKREWCKMYLADLAETIAERKENRDPLPLLLPSCWLENRKIASLTGDDEDDQEDGDNDGNKVPREMPAPHHKNTINTTGEQDKAPQLIVLHPGKGILWYKPNEDFQWKVNRDKEKMAGYLQYLSDFFVLDKGSHTLLSPVAWMKVHQS